MKYTPKTTTTPCWCDDCGAMTLVSAVGAAATVAAVIVKFFSIPYKQNSKIICQPLSVSYQEG